MRITCFGNFGSSNYGNEATLVAVLAHLRVVYPDATYCCVCPNPVVVKTRYGIEAVPIALGRHLWRLTVLRRYLSALRLLRRSDMFLVPGTGLLTDAYGFPDWGLYSVFKWSFMARFCRCKVVFLSVGAGPIYSAKGRLLARLALPLAHYRSYRDDASKASLHDIGCRVAGDDVYPDLVFSLPNSLIPPEAKHSQSGRAVVGLGLMVYAGRYSAHEPSEQIYLAYLDALAAFAERLLAQGYDIRLLAGDDDDELAIQEFISLLGTRLGTLDEQRVVYQPISSVQGLLSSLAGTDFVVATRFHNVLLALLLDKPVIAISFHHKSSSLMEEMGLTEYTHDISRMDIVALVAQFRDLEAKNAPLKTEIARKVERLRSALDDQFATLFTAG